MPLQLLLQLTHGGKVLLALLHNLGRNFNPARNLAPRRCFSARQRRYARRPKIRLWSLTDGSVGGSDGHVYTVREARELLQSGVAYTDSLTLWRHLTHDANQER